jgi:recombination protein RecT
MPKSDILKHAKGKSQAYQADLKYKTEKSPWFTDFDSMACKTVLKSMLTKYAPLSIDFITAIQHDDFRPETEQNEIVEVEFFDETEKGEGAKVRTEKSEPVQEKKQEPVDDDIPY